MGFAAVSATAEPRRSWSRAARDWLWVAVVSLLATFPVQRLRAFPSSLSDCQTPTGWNCSGDDDRDTDLFLCDTNTCKFDGECLRIGDIITCICDFKTDGYVHVCVAYLGKRWHQDALWDEGKTGGGSLMGPGIHVDVILTRTTYLNIVADQVHPFMATVFPNGSGLFQQDNATCHTAKLDQEWFEEYGKEFKVLTPNSPDVNPIQHL
ncbi:hypothetical protein PDJAM_G00208470 [Pangasius djambal]|uniref:Uncharacterized protein n=1 Tax=Pangasius djambal TaxID=1691987 RepID=A0ACC5Y9B5_9TELE|nr:hypothetical protein [Pangasius djambal]